MLQASRVRLGEFDPPELGPHSRISPERDLQSRRTPAALALAMARESIVLLKNQDDVLPLDKSKLKRLAVIGPHAAMFTPGAYSGKADPPVNSALLASRIGAIPRTGNSLCQRL